MASRRPRIVLGFAVVLLTTVLALFAIAIVQSRNNERDAARQRFHDAAVVSAALTESVFSASAGQTAQQNAERFGSTPVDLEKLTAQATQSRLSYALVLDDRGVVLAATPGTKASVVQRFGKRTPDVDRVLKGAPFRLSGVMPGGGMEYYSAFKAAGGTRVFVSGFPPLLISTFLGSYLAQLPDAENQRAYVIDSADRVVASTDRDTAPGSRATIAAEGREIAQAPVGGSNWRIVLSEGTAILYRGIGSAVQWLILAALAAAGLVVVLLLIRSARTAADLQTAYSGLTGAHADLEQANAELLRSNSELEQFASVASHDLQEPLRKVQTFGDQLERRFGDELPDEAKDYLRRMRGAAGRMSTLIEDLLRFSRVTTHAKAPERIDLRVIARAVTRDLDALVAETHGRVDIDPELPAVLADPTQMRQLLQNLIGNALKFHRPGEPPVVTVAGAPAPSQGMASFTVADNGIGFEPEYEERIFRVFERLHPRDVYSGTGIGLALCRKIVERHGGTIRAEGRPGEGAVLTVTLPAAGAAPAPPAAPVPETAGV